MKFPPPSACVFSVWEVKSIKKFKHRLLSERGEASYISTFIYILVVVIMIAFILNVFHIISVKQEMDHLADQMVKQIQLNGGVNHDTDALFAYLSDNISGTEPITYDITCSGNPSRIQIGTPFYISVSTTCYLGGFGNFNLFPIHIRSQGAGVSEHYWK